jgi:hypothetical protein
MTKHNELIDVFLKTSTGRNFLRLCVLSLKMCVNIADPTQASGVGEGYVLQVIEWSVFLYSLLFVC